MQKPKRQSHEDTYRHIPEKLGFIPEKYEPLLFSCLFWSPQNDNRNGFESFIDMHMASIATIYHSSVSLNMITVRCFSLFLFLYWTFVMVLSAQLFTQKLFLTFFSLVVYTEIVYCLSLGKITPQLLLYVNPFTPPCNFFPGNGNVIVALDYKILQLILLFKNKNEIELL